MAETYVIITTIVSLLVYTGLAATYCIHGMHYIEDAEHKMFYIIVALLYAIMVCNYIYKLYVKTSYSKKKSY
uniref:Uncharacterized protein n=1 Tax=Megaviridae environmental sample TaxID=1737588 RepID=A0A5J6VI88_9VIRU|nr:MAG: hypothetical protein [Megaviridae environmental sample]